MAGRAGRRGLDKVGTVIMCCFGEEPPPQQILKQMLTGSSTLLSSQFRLTYNMILNLLRVEEMSVESMIARSFSEFATQRALTAQEYPKLLKRGQKTLEKLEEDYEKGAINRDGLEDLEDYYQLCQRLLKINAEILGYVLSAERDMFEDACCPGRAVLISMPRKFGCVRAPALILKTGASILNHGATSRDEMETDKSIICLILLPASFVLTDDFDQGKPSRVGYIGTFRQRNYTIHSILLHQIVAISSKKIKIDSKSLLVEENVRSKIALSSLPEAKFYAGNRPERPTDPFANMVSIGKRKESEATSKHGAVNSDDQLSKALDFLLDTERAEQQRGKGWPTLDLSSYVRRGADAVSIQQSCLTSHDLISKMRTFSAHYNPNLEKYYEELERKDVLRSHIETLQNLLSNESLSLFPDFMNKKGVLQKLGYIDENETVTVKGRVACECNSSEELVLTEMIFEGILDDLEPEEIAASLSALVFQGRSSDDELDVELPENLLGCCGKMRTIGENLGFLQREQGLKIEPSEYCEASMNFGLVHVVYEWALGVPFKNICDLTEVKEGLIVRAITRLDELLREVRNCARVIGNPSLYRKVEAASAAIKRDIVFASSLYVS